MERVYETNCKADFHYHHNGCCILIFATSDPTRFDFSIQDMNQSTFQNVFEVRRKCTMEEAALELYNLFLARTLEFLREQVSLGELVIQ